jgi:hypothetical protein
MATAAAARPARRFYQKAFPESRLDPTLCANSASCGLTNVQRSKRRPSPQLSQNVMNHFEARNEVMLLVGRADLAPHLAELFAMQRLNVPPLIQILPT